MDSYNFPQVTQLAIPFFVAAPYSTVDLATADGSGIPIEERDGREVTHIGDRQLAPAGVRVRNPGFDVTPAKLIRAIITDRGIVSAPWPGALAKLLAPR